MFVWTIQGVNLAGDSKVKLQRQLSRQQQLHLCSDCVSDTYSLEHKSWMEFSICCSDRC